LTSAPGKHSRFDLLVALHARKSFPALAAFRARYPGKPVVVALTGTDLYDDLLRGDADVASALRLANQLVVLQPKAIERLPAEYRHKANALFQSVAPPKAARTNRYW